MCGADQGGHEFVMYEAECLTKLTPQCPKGENRANGPPPMTREIRRRADSVSSLIAILSRIILFAEVTSVEVAAGLAVIERVGRIRKAERERAYRRLISQLVHRYPIMPLRQDDSATAVYLTQEHPLKAYDAMQLETSLCSL
jgi:hypothetical protein